MQNGSHFTPAEPVQPRRMRRLAGMACGAVAVGATALLVVDLTGGPGHARTLGVAASAPASSPAAPSSTTASSTTAAPTTTVPATTTSAPVPAPVLPDGSGLPVLVVFNGNTITLAGSVPNEADAAQLRVLAEANSKTTGAQVIDHLVVDARVPTSVGVRVIEMNAVRFAEGSSAISPDYAPELARVISLMKAMPWVTTLVIGHADQTGASGLNLQLSQARANSVIGYLVSQGISPDRLSAQGVGDREPLTTQNTDSAWALNRRTEFVFYGLFSSTARS